MSADAAGVANGTGDDDLIDSELARALESYLGAVEAGRPVDPDRLAAEYPAIADQLRSCVGVLRLASRVQDPDGSKAADDAGAGFTDLGLLGDFRLLRAVGRGGMGIVYEAEQVSLHRQVALKVLPFAAALDPRQLRRFQTEAQAAAQLHHTNIVPVFSVGCERGVHYYAMQFIEGKTLAELIRELRQLEGRDALDQAATVTTDKDLSLASMLVSGQLGPTSRAPSPGASTAFPEPAPVKSSPKRAAAKLQASSSSRTFAYFRTVAGLGIEAADALDHAHQEGVIHRDIKPANLMVDIKGHLWITDFGLARLQNDSGLTLSGDLVGTIRYMSPEQAIGRRAVVDHRTEIYSLGVTLFELLALEPAFSGVDRRELLRRIIEDEPRPLRSINASVPRDLETIVYKAMARDVRQRYASGAELADDLRRSLDHRPIQARRPSIWTRARKLVRRHRTAAAAVATVLLVVGISATVIVSQQRHTEGLERIERSRRYVDEVRAASHMVERCRLNEAREILARHLPKPGQEDVRSFTWFHLWRICNYQPTFLQGHSDSAAKAVYHIEVSPHGELLASCGEDGAVRLWNLQTGRLVRTLRGHDGDVNFVAFSPDNLTLATGGDDGTVRLWSLSGDDGPITLGKHTNWVNCVLFTRDGQKLISAARDGQVKVWDVARRQPLISVAAHPPTVEGMALSPDGRTLVTAGGDGKVSLWATDSLHRIRDLVAQPFSVQSVAFSHDGLRVATANVGGTVEVWDVARGQVVMSGRVPIVGRDGGVQCVAFSPDDSSLASCGNDGAVRIWDVGRGNAIQTYRAEEARLWCVAFSHDGRDLLSCGADGRIRQ